MTQPLDPIVEQIVRRLEDKIESTARETGLQLHAMGDKVEAGKGHAEQLVTVITTDLKYVQTGVAELKVAQGDIRNDLTDRISDLGKRFDSRLDAHVDAPNPHPNLEKWLRDRHDNLNSRVETIRDEITHLRGERAGRAPLSRFAWAVAAAVSGAVGTAVALLVLHLRP